MQSKSEVILRPDELRPDLKTWPISPDSKDSTCSSNDAVIEIDQCEESEMPKLLQQRLQQCFTPLSCVSLYPYARIDCKTMQILSYVKNEEDKLVLRLEHKPNLNVLEILSHSSPSLPSTSKFKGLQDKINQTKDNISMKFSDEKGFQLFSSVSFGDATTVYCDADVLGTLNTQALQFSNIPKIVATNPKGEAILEIPVNLPNNEKPNSRSKLQVFSEGKLIGFIRKATGRNSSYFQVSFLQGLDCATKAVILTTAFLLVIKFFPKTTGPNTKHVDDRKCCLLDWTVSTTSPLLVLACLMAGVFMVLTVMAT